MIKVSAVAYEMLVDISRFRKIKVDAMLDELISREFRDHRRRR